MNYYDDAGVERILFRDIGGYYRHLRMRLQAILHQIDGAWSITQPKLVYDDPVHQNGDIRSMTCFTDRVKVVKIISTNPHRVQNPSVSVGATMLLDYNENFPVCIYDAPTMSGVRTAAMAALAVDFNFQHSYPDRILIVGRGRVGKFTDRLIREIWPSIPLDVWDERDGGRTNGFNGYDVVITATNSQTPFIYDQNCDAELLVSVGADTHFNRELSGSFVINRRNIYVDTESAKEVGDLRELAISNHVRGNLFFMMEKKDADLFISVGHPLMDALTVEYLYANG